ncbi:MAG: hypothetical protein ABR544_10355, partial [Gammaproteobacteria bacterium]
MFEPPGAKDAKKTIFSTAKAPRRQENCHELWRPKKGSEPFFPFSDHNFLGVLAVNRVFDPPA